MTTQLARPHRHLSNRAKVRSALERKPAFKGVLENPFHIGWYVHSGNPLHSTTNRPQAITLRELTECCPGSPRGSP